ncbi:hypothetical protein MNB_SV-15-283 [hydrothermal vent metagenome]|uniref:Uncharacterized protein n=1 Tax=hydrothermal vent metagenome TaxID=652676 RepID=A0A1W1EIL7_9ZZZZ
MISAKEKLANEKKLLERQLYWLEIAYQDALIVGIRREYNAEEFGKMELLCSRYSRSVNFLIRKIFRDLDDFEFEDKTTLIDVINHAYDRYLFENIDEVRMIKDIKNRVVSEYIDDNLVEIFSDVLEYTAPLIEIINNTIRYMQKIE